MYIFFSNLLNEQPPTHPPTSENCSFGKNRTEKWMTPYTDGTDSITSAADAGDNYIYVSSSWMS